MDADEARELALKYLAEQRLKSIRLKLSELPEPGVYGFEREGWAIFRVDELNKSSVGGSEYVAVHLETGEARSLGVIGE